MTPHTDPVTHAQALLLTVIGKLQNLSVQAETDVAERIVNGIAEHTREALAAITRLHTNVVPLVPGLAVLLPDIPGTLQAFYVSIYCTNASEHRLMIWGASRDAVHSRAGELARIYRWDVERISVR